MRKAKRPLTIMEVMIALCLASILLFVLFNVQQKIALSRIKLTSAKEEVLSHQVFHLRLSQVLNALEKEDKEEEESSSFYTEEFGKGPAFFFSYQNDVDPNPKFCGIIQEMLYLNEKKEVCLISWSKEGESRKEVFFNNIKSMQFEFFDVSSQKWTDSWDKKNKKLPAMVKITMKETFKETTLKKLIQDIMGELKFVFFIKPEDQPIVYKTKK